MVTNFIFDIYFILPELYLTISIFYLLIFGVLLSVSKVQGYPLLSEAFGYLTIQVIFFILYLILNFSYSNIVSWSGFIIEDHFIIGTKIILSLSIICWVFLSKTYVVQEKVNSFEYWILILLVVLALFLILQVYDITAAYLVIEFQSLSFYVLTSFKRSSEFSTEAGLKYFVLGAFASAFLLFGFSLLYGLTGLTNFLDLSILFTGFFLEDKFLVSGAFTSLIFIISALLFKISAVPFHMWSPDVYEGAPTSITAFFTIFPKFAIISLLLRIFFFMFYDFFSIWKSIFIIVSFLSLVIGSFGALLQKRWKRFLAYSSINHVGFILVGFLTGELTGISSIIIYIIIYIVTSFAIFTFLMSLRFVEYPNQYQIRYLSDISNLSRISPLLAISLALVLFSMAGIPPLAGFFAKVFILLVGIQSSSYFVVIFAVLTSSVACFYYIRIIQLLYFKTQQKLAVINPLTKVNSLVLSISCVFLLLFFLDIELFSIPVYRMALSFLI